MVYCFKEKLCNVFKEFYKQNCYFLFVEKWYLVKIIGFFFIQVSNWFKNCWQCDWNFFEIQFKSELDGNFSIEDEFSKGYEDLFFYLFFSLFDGIINFSFFSYMELVYM